MSEASKLCFFPCSVNDVIHGLEMCEADIHGVSNLLSMTSYMELGYVKQGIWCFPCSQ
jgi:hypothetical protein